MCRYILEPYLFLNRHYYFRRGPNKYTRNWEDEAAYKSASFITVGRGKGRGGSRGRGRGGRIYREEAITATPGSNQEDFPVLGERRPKRSSSKPRTLGINSSPTAPSLSVAVKKIPKHFNARAKSNDRNKNHVSDHLPVSKSNSNSITVSTAPDTFYKDETL